MKEKNRNLRVFVCLYAYSGNSGSSKDVARRFFYGGIVKRKWIKLYVDQCLRGTMMDELTVPQRYIWYQLLLMAGDSNIEGVIYHRLEADTRRPIGFNFRTLADLICVEEKELQTAIPIFITHGKISTDDLNAIFILNWEKYQSEYQRQKKYRQGDKKKCNQPSNQSNTLDLDRDIELDKEEKNKKEDKHSQKEVKVLFEKLRNSFPSHRRGKRDYCFKKFKALVKAGKLEEFRAATIGYFEFLKDRKLNHNFEQEAVGLSTWLNNWEGDKEMYIGFKYEPRL